MRKLITLALALMSLCTFTPRSADAETYHSQFLGVCQTGGHNIYAHYRPVECSNGCVEWRWVTDQHNHCRPAYRGNKRNDVFRSHLFNPANKKRSNHRCVSNGTCCN